MVISAAGGDACHLLYLAALVPDPGQTNAQASAAAATEIRKEAIALDDGGRTVSLRGPHVAAVLIIGALKSRWHMPLRTFAQRPQDRPRNR
jgi:hypothetical protein